LTVGPPVSSTAAFRAPRIADERRRAEAQAEAAVRDLVGTGWDARSSVAAGNPAHEIIRAAADLGCDLIVMGSRGHTGLDRIRLGSVARNVLLHTHASVLIVREQIQWLPSEPAETNPGAAELLSW
jgi:nucleotide-binding universal stress UspA family protein